jgi:hypothetical protein
LCILAENMQTAQSIRSVLLSKPIEKLIDKVCRWSGYYSAAIMYNIPALPTDRIYSDADVLDALGIIDKDCRDFWLT